MKSNNLHVLVVLLPCTGFLSSYCLADNGAGENGMKI